LRTPLRTIPSVTDLRQPETLGASGVRALFSGPDDPQLRQERPKDVPDLSGDLLALLVSGFVVAND
jgi:hypothetical protein